MIGLVGALIAMAWFIFGFLHFFPVLQWWTAPSIVTGILVIICVGYWWDNG